MFLSSLLPAQQTLHSQAYGNPTNPALIFLHGGPGYDAFSFEATTAEVLADRGFYVIVYDRRGEGRSLDISAEYTFKQSIFDLDSLYDKYAIESASLIGHSFGGVIGTKFTEVHPDKVRSLVLVAAPLSVQASLKNILDRSRDIYVAANDSVQLNNLRLIEAMDTTSVYYSGWILSHAINNGFYQTESPDSSTIALYKLVSSERKVQQLPILANYDAPIGFHNNEDYTFLDLSGSFQEFIANGLPIYGIYGTEDGLYSAAEINRIENLLGTNHFRRIENASHNVFIDQQPIFLDLIEQWAK